MHGSENVAILGTLMIADPSQELRENTFSKFTSQEHHLAAFQNESYMDAANNPEKIMNESYADYQIFMKKAQTVANQLNDINSTNTLDISISAYGQVNVQWKPGVFPTDQSMMEKDAINQWVSKNTETIQELKSLGSRYALSKSMFDYEAATGISHDTLIQNSQKPFEGEADSAEIYSRKLYEYATKMMRYSMNSFGVNPISYSQVDQHVKLNLPLRSRSLSGS